MAEDYIKTTDSSMLGHKKGKGIQDPQLPPETPAESVTDDATGEIAAGID